MVDKKNKDNPQSPKQDPDKRMADASAELAKLEAELKASSSIERASSSNKDNQVDSKPTTKATASTKTQQGSTSKHSNAPRKPQNTKQKSSFSWLGLFGFLFGLIALAGVAYLYWLQMQTNNQQTNQLEQTQIIAQQSVVEARKAVQQVQNNLNTLQLSQQTNNDFVLDSQRQLNSLRDRIKELGQSQPNTWLAAESLYLVNLAERRLLVEQDVGTAIQLLVDANIRLDAMNDPSVFYLREAISEDLALLAAIKKPETDAVYLSLSGVLSQLESLPLAHIYVPDPAEAPQKPSVSEDVKDWQSNLVASVKRFMGNFITVTRRDTAVEPELPPKQRWYVRANIRQQLLIAQQSTLKGNDTIYHDALSHAERWLKQYFDLTQPPVVATINTLNELKNKNVALTLPSDLSSQAMLSQYVIGLMQLQQSEAQNPQPTDGIEATSESDNIQPPQSESQSEVNNG